MAALWSWLAVICIIAAGFCLGMSVMVLAGHSQFRAPRHVLAVASGAIVLLVVTALRIYFGHFKDAPGWLIPIAASLTLIWYGVALVLRMRFK